MPRVSLSNNNLLECLPCHAALNNHYKTSSLYSKVNTHKSSLSLSPKEINEILSSKLYSQSKTKINNEREFIENNASNVPAHRSYKISINSIHENAIDPDLITLINRFFDLTYLNTVPMVNLLATAVATNCLKENIQALDKKLQEQQAANSILDMKQACSSLCTKHDYADNEYDDDISWALAPAKT